MHFGQIIIAINVRARKLLDIIVFLVARILSITIDGRGVWLIAEKVDEARDNGYWFYHYLRKVHPNAKAYYVIIKNSADYWKIKDLGEDRVIEPNTWRHRMLFWAAEFNVCSQPQSNYFSAYLPLKSFRKKYQKTVFLQHGIIKDNLSHGIDATVSGIDIFVTSAKREQEAIIKRHGYDERRCVLTGLCRFDNLPLSRPQNSRTILVMPTFRHWLLPNRGNVATEAEKELFRKDDFCKIYNSLLSSPKLAELLDQYDYTLVFYPHYCAQPFLDCYEDDGRTQRVILASKNKYDVQQLLVESDILVTDFSSIFFDFAYMKKPELFFQFDEERYRGKHYEEGYFKYRHDAFGPVFTKVEEVLTYLEGRLIEGARMEEKYVDRVNRFFAFTDGNNCARTYNVITNYKE